MKLRILFGYNPLIIYTPAYEIWGIFRMRVYCFEVVRDSVISTIIPFVSAEYLDNKLEFDQILHMH